MNVLIACEESQTECIAFRKRGHNAFSCDIQNCSGGHPEWHVKGDVLEILNPINGKIAFVTCTGVRYEIPRWDMIIAHPPCTYLSVVGACNNEKDPSRIEKGFIAAEFFKKFLEADCDRICVENPRPQARFNLPPKSQVKGDSIERFYQLNLSHLYRSTLRLNLKENVTYVYGASGTGKTSGIFEKHGYLNVYRVTDYKHPFDSYNGQKILVFEEFRNSLKIEDMLNYLDIYPLMLPARYGDKVACYDTVYIVSNWTLEQQYETVQKEHKTTYEALMRRITTVRHYTGFKKFEDKPNVTYKQITLTELKGAELDEIDDIF